MISGEPQEHFTAHCIVCSVNVNVNVNVTNNNKKNVLVLFSVEYMPKKICMLHSITNFFGL